MTTINSAYQNALLADATYALEVDGLLNMSGTELRDMLKDRMTPALAKYISDNYTVVTHIESNDIVGSGFDATVWKDNTTGKLTVSMQGTSGLQDFLSDADLAVTANARAQIVDMVNWWFKITTPQGQSARQIALEPIFNSSTPPVQLGTRFAAAPDITGTGQVPAAALVAGIEVNGHSLGGYLATAFTRLFGSQAHVQHTSTFNSAGFINDAVPSVTCAVLPAARCARKRGRKIATTNSIAACARIHCARAQFDNKKEPVKHKTARLKQSAKRATSLLGKAS